MKESDLKWCSGIRAFRNKANGKIQLMQDTYINKIADKFGHNGGNVLSLPIIPITLGKRENKILLREIEAYQERIGLILYAAIKIGPDIAKTAHVLLRFVTNPFSTYARIADQFLKHLSYTRYLAIQYDNNNYKVIGASDVFFYGRQEDYEIIIKILNNNQGWTFIIESYASSYGIDFHYNNGDTWSGTISQKSIRFTTNALGRRIWFGNPLPNIL